MHADARVQYATVLDGGESVFRHVDIEARVAWTTQSGGTVMYLT